MERPMPHFSEYTEGNEAASGRKACSATLPAASFTAAQTWKQPGCPSMGDWVRARHIHHGGLLGHKKWWTLTLCDSEDAE